MGGEGRGGVEAVCGGGGLGGDGGGEDSREGRGDVAAAATLL